MRIPPWLFCPSYGSWQKENVPCLLDIECTCSWDRQFTWNMIPIIKNSKNQDRLLKLVKIFPKFQKKTTVVPMDSLLSLSQSAGTVIWRGSCATVDMNQMKILLLKYIPNCTSYFCPTICLNKEMHLFKLLPALTRTLNQLSISG